MDSCTRWNSQKKRKAPQLIESKQVEVGDIFELEVKLKGQVMILYFIIFLIGIDMPVIILIDAFPQIEAGLPQKTFERLSAEIEHISQ